MSHPLYPGNKYIAPIGGPPQGYIPPTFSPLRERRDVPLRLHQYGWVHQPAMCFLPLPDGLTDGSVCIVRKITDEPREPRGNARLLQLEDERGRIHDLHRSQFFLGYQFRLHGHHGWLWEHDPLILAVLRDELAGHYDDRFNEGELTLRQAIITRTETLRWRGMVIVRK